MGVRLGVGPTLWGPNFVINRKKRKEERRKKSKKRKLTKNVWDAASELHLKNRIEKKNKRN